MRKFAIYLLLLSVFGLSGQNKSNDSLYQKINNCKDSASKIEYYLILGNNYYILNQFEKSLLYHMKAFDLATILKDTVLVIECSKSLMNDYSRSGSKALSLSSCMKGLELSETVKDSASMSDFYRFLGIAFWSENENEKSLSYYFKALEILKGKKRRREIAGIYNNIGLNYRNLKNYKEALKYYQLSVELAQEIGEKSIEMETYNNMAYVYDVTSDNQKSILYYNNSLALARTMHNRFQEGIVLGNLGSIYRKTKDFKKAESFMLQSLHIAKTIDDIEGEIENYDNLSNLYEEMGDSKKALTNYKNYLQVKLAYDKENNAKDLQREVIKHEFEKEIVQIQRNQDVKDAKAAIEKEKNYFIIAAITIGFIIVSVLLIFLYNRFKLIQTQKRIIESQKKLVEEKQKEVLDSIHYAKRIQTTLLAHHDFISENLPNNFILFKPKDIVSGDFYWANKRKNLFYLAVCDSTGHGVPGAFMSLLNINFLNEAITEKNIIEPHKILDYVRDRLVNSISKEGQKDGFDGILVCLDKQTNQITYAAANNEPVLICKNEIIELPKDKMPVGLGEKSDGFQLFTYNPQHGDTIYFYTDGYADQFGGRKGKKFKYKQLNELLKSINSLNLEEQKEILQSKFSEWSGDLEQVDDVCIIGIRL